MLKYSEITRDHILDAMRYIGSDPSAWPHGSQLKVYVVVDPRNGAHLPPKLVFATAARIATSSSGELRHVFSGGSTTNKRLERLGFHVLQKSQARPG
jgi:hypothetical protein